MAPWVLRLTYSLSPKVRRLVLQRLTKAKLLMDVYWALHVKWDVLGGSVLRQRETSAIPL